MIKHISNRLTNDVIDYILQEYERVQRLEVPFINGFYDESTIQEYLDMALVTCGSLRILADMNCATSLQTIKNHHFFTTHFWISPEHFKSVDVAIYLNAHHDFDRPVRVRNVSKVGCGYVAKLEFGQEFELALPHFGGEEEFDVNGTLGIRFSDLTSPLKYYQYNPAYNSFKRPESGQQIGAIEVLE